MSIKTLKKQHQDLTINIVDILSSMDPSEDNKMTPFLIKMYRKHFDKEKNKEVIDNNRPQPLKLSKMASPNLNNTIRDVIFNVMGYEQFEKLVLFNSHLKNKRIENTDVTTYSDWSDIEVELSKAELKAIDKEMLKQIEIIHQDDEWLILKPLSFKASLTYGSNTKWCTAMKNNPHYFYNYSRNGILIYVINKVNGSKYGFYSSSEEFSAWNQIDKRIDSIESNIPFELLSKIKESSDLTTNPTNYSKFSEQELKNEFEIGVVDEIPTIGMVQEEMMVMGHVDMTVRDEMYEGEIYEGEGGLVNDTWI
jgi:hypothetical protein